MSDIPERNEGKYEAELRRRVGLVKKLIDEDKLRFGDTPTVIESLKKVRYAPDGVVDLSTVDAIVRSVANAIAVMEDRREMKEALSLRDIQSKYFEFVQRHFGWLYEDMIQYSATPHQMASVLSTKKEIYSQTEGVYREFMETITEFWTNVADVAYAHVEDSNDLLKGVFGGDMFPNASESIVSNVGLYLDTVIVPDPFLRARIAMETGDAKRKTYYLLKYGLTLLQYRDVATADLETPLLVVLPDYTALNPEEREFVMRFSEPDVLAHANRIFGQEFESVEDMFTYANRLDTVEKVLRSIQDATRVVFDVEEEDSLEERIKRATESEVANMIGTSHPGIAVASIALTRLGTANELLLKARRLGGTPIIDAPTSWQFYKWKLQYDSERAFPNGANEHHGIVRSLQTLSTGGMEWLGKIPHEALIEIRQQGALSEIRSIIRQGITDVGGTSDEDIAASTDRIVANLEDAFRIHREGLAELTKKKWRFAGVDVGRWLVTGTVEVAALATGSAELGFLGYLAHQVLDAPTLKELPLKYQSIMNDETQIRSSPVGLLFQHKP